MTGARNVIRWVALLACIAASLLLLNGAIFRGWIATGPPNDNPTGWLFSAWNYMAWSGAAFLAGVGLFLLLRRPHPIKFVVACLVVACVLAALPWLREFIASDKCLDSGGSWSTQALRCTHGSAEA
jgi:hypothetical protein